MSARGESDATARKPKRSTPVSVDLNGDQDTGVPRLIDLDLVRGLIEAVDQSGIDTLEIRRGSTRIRIAKTPPLANHAAPAQPAGITPASAGSPEPTTTPSPAGSGVAAARDDTHYFEVKSPMVGTFYRAPAPEAPPYVEIGSTVTKGQTLCILEAMKLMNELESEVDGVVAEILASNADPIEYGQVLFRIAPAGPS